MIASPVVGRVVKVAVTALLLAALFVVLDTEKLANALFRIAPPEMAAGIALCFLFTATRIAKWVILSRSNGLFAPTWIIVRSMLFALALGIVTPGRVGEVVAIVPFPKQQRSKALLAYVFDRLYELSTIVFLCAPAAVIFLPRGGILVAIGLVVGTVGVVAIMQSHRLRTAVVRYLPARTPRRISELLSAPIRTSVPYWIVSFSCYLLTYASVAVFIAGIDTIESLRSLLVLPVVTLSNLVTITIGGLGVREGLAALVSPVAGLEPEAAAAAFFLSFFWTRLIPGLVGLALTFFSGFGLAPQPNDASPPGDN